VGQNVLIILTCYLQNVSFLLRHFVLITFFVRFLCKNPIQPLKYHYVKCVFKGIILGIVIALVGTSLFTSEHYALQVKLHYMDIT